MLCNLRMVACLCGSAVLCCFARSAADKRTRLFCRYLPHEWLLLTKEQLLDRVCAALGGICTTLNALHDVPSVYPAGGAQATLQSASTCQT
jgi:hypothetical protein